MLVEENDTGFPSCEYIVAFILPTGSLKTRSVQTVTACILAVETVALRPS